MDLHLNWILPKLGRIAVPRKSLQEYNLTSLGEEKCYSTQVHMVRPNQPKHRSLEQRKVYCKGNALLVLKKPKLRDGLWGRVFIGKICREGYRVYDLPLIGWW